jgi:hypothetical protein
VHLPALMALCVLCCGLYSYKVCALARGGKTGGAVVLWLNGSSPPPPPPLLPPPLFESCWPILFMYGHTHPPNTPIPPSPSYSQRLVAHNKHRDSRRVCDRQPSSFRFFRQRLLLLGVSLFPQTRGRTQTHTHTPTPSRLREDCETLCRRHNEQQHRCSTPTTSKGGRVSTPRGVVRWISP